LLANRIKLATMMWSSTATQRGERSTGGIQQNYDLKRNIASGSHGELD
jgi:hypothetical protein